MRLEVGRVALAALTMWATMAGAATLKISCGAVGHEYELCKRASEEWASKTGNQIQVVTTPNDSNERLALYQQILASGSDKVDVFQIDVIWPGLLAQHLIDLRPYSRGLEKTHFESMVADATVDGRLVAMPWFIDAGLLFYRRDLLEKYRLPPPTSWEELAVTARKVQDAERAAGNDKLWGFVWQGRAYEGLSCNAIEWIASHDGGTIVDTTGRVTINNPRAIRALDAAASWVGTISPRAVLNYGEEEARGVFQAGNAVFLRNWPYVWSLAQTGDSPIRGKVGVTALPRGGQGGHSAAALGGWQLSVSRYSRHPRLAIDLVMHLTSLQVQKERALRASYNPTITSLYKDDEVLRANPFMGELYATFIAAVDRPSSVTAARYAEVSRNFWDTVHGVIAGQSRASEALPELAQTLERIAPGGRWKQGPAP